MTIIAEKIKFLMLPNRSVIKNVNYFIMTLFAW